MGRDKKTSSEITLISKAASQVMKAANITPSGEMERKIEGKMHQCPENEGRETSRQMKDQSCLWAPGPWVRPCRNAPICLSEGTRSSNFETQLEAKGSEELLSEQLSCVRTALDIVTSISSSLCSRSKHDGS